MRTPPRSNIMARVFGAVTPGGAAIPDGLEASVPGAAGCADDEKREWQFVLEVRKGNGRNSSVKNANKQQAASYKPKTTYIVVPHNLILTITTKYKNPPRLVLIKASSKFINKPPNLSLPQEREYDKGQTWAQASRCPVGVEKMSWLMRIAISQSGVPFVSRDRMVEAARE